MSLLNNFTTTHVVNNVIAIQHLSSKAVELLMLRINRRVLQWLSEWSFSDHNPVIDIVAHSQVDADFQLLSNGEHIIATSKNYVDWKHLIFSKHSIGVPTDDIFSLILETAKRNFYGAVFSAISDVESTIDFKPISKGDINQTPVDSIHDLGPKFISIHIRLDKESIFIVVPFSVCRNLGQPNGLNTQLKSLSIQDINISISAHVELKFGSHLLSDINSLEVGDVLSTKTLLKESFDLCIGKNKIAKVSLGKIGKRKTVSII